MDITVKGKSCCVIGPENFFAPSDFYDKAPYVISDFVRKNDISTFVFGEKPIGFAEIIYDTIISLPEAYKYHKAYFGQTDIKKDFEIIISPRSVIENNNSERLFRYMIDISEYCIFYCVPFIVPIKKAYEYALQTDKVILNMAKS